MGGLILFVAFVVLIWSARVALSPRTNKWVRIGYLVCIVGVGFAAYYSTFHVTFQRDENTKTYGWPVPAAVLARKSPDDNWVDYVMPVFVAYPLNFLLLALVPGIATILLARLTRPRE